MVAFIPGEELTLTRTKFGCGTCTMFVDALEVQAALAKFFVGLQNVSEDLYPAFEALAKRTPKAFLKATNDAAFSRVRLANARWLIAALHSASSDPTHAAEISREAQEWLRRHSLAPEVGMFRHTGRDAAKEAAELARLQGELETRLSALSAPEREFMSSRLKEERTSDRALV